MSEKKDRNDPKEVEGDINFIGEILSYMENHDLTSAKVLLGDWQHELKEMLGEDEKCQDCPEPAGCVDYTLVIKG